MTLTGGKLLAVLIRIRDDKEVSVWYRRWLMREGYITRDKKPVSGPGRPGFYYSLTQKSQEIVDAVPQG